MKPGILHRVCAHPVAIAWVLFGIGLNAILLTNLAGEHTWPPLLLDPATAFWTTLLCAIIALASFIPACMAHLPLSAACARCNGAPLRLGDRVHVLAGEHRGKVATVDKVSRGQNGLPLARLELDVESRRKFHDLFEEHALCRLNPRSV